jgi:hypothetical protein
MGLSLIQEQVLEALVKAANRDPRGLSRALDRGVHPSAVREVLRERRPRATSERRVRVVLRELADQRVDGLPIVEELHAGRGRRVFAPLNAGIDHAARAAALPPGRRGY